MLELSEIWENHIIHKQNKLLPKKITHFSDTVRQSHFTVPPGTKIVFISNKKTLEPVTYYGDLDEVNLTEEERHIVENTSHEILGRNPPNNRDGCQLLVSSVLYDPEQCTVYLEVKKTRYSLLISLNRKQFSEDSSIYQQDFYELGAFVPLITEDDHVVLLQLNRHDLKPFSTIRGMIEAKQGDETLLQDKDLSLVEKIAQQQLFNKLSLPENIHVSTPEISAVSFRKSNDGSPGFVELILPVYLNCTQEQLTHIVLTNQAPGSRELTHESKSIDLRSDCRTSEYEDWAKNTLPGSDMYPCFISEGTRRVTGRFNKRYDDITWPKMPGSRGEAYDPLFFKTDPHGDKGLLPYRLKRVSEHFIEEEEHDNSTYRM